jgi:hypothetical protein
VDLSIYFRPSQRFGKQQPDWSIHALGAATRFNSSSGFPDLAGVNIAVLGVLDDPGHARPR